MESVSVTRQQRFNRRRPCPICGGFDEALRGKQIRCFGFLSQDRKYANCTREESAGALPLNPDSQTYAHRLHRRL